MPCYHTMHLLTLIFGIVLLPKAYTLKCYECAVSSSNCTGAVTECPLASQQCAAQKITSYAAGVQQIEINSKSCALPDQCLDGSFNFGMAKTVITSKCCTSELCNSKPASAPSESFPNGKKCFTCEGQQCTATLNCERNEDYCISAKVTIGSETVIMKGCASKVMCSAQTAQVSQVIGAGVNCCQGDMCNSGSSTRAGLLLLVAPLLSLFVVS